MPNVFVDARCFQDPNYATRGIGRSTMSLLRHRPAELRQPLVGLCDPALPPLDDAYAEVFDELRDEVQPLRRPHLFFNPSPLTHPSGFLAPLLAEPLALRAAYVHDFIPYDFPGEFGGAGGYLEYSRSLEQLKRYDLYFANSAYTRERATAILKIPAARIERCGIAPRQGFFAADESALPAEERDLLANALGSGGAVFASVAGDAPRKNIECAVAAARLLGERLHGRCRLVVAGRYARENRDRIADLYPAGVVFLPEVSDGALAVLLQRALACIVPSRVEGYSMPVVETIAAGGLVLASDCAAHRELVTAPEALFGADRPEELAARMAALLSDPGLRDRLIAGQRPAIDGLTETAVAARFWSRLQAAAGAKTTASATRRNGAAAAAILGHARPRFAFVSPYVPQPSGVALMTACALPALGQSAEVDLFTESEIDVAQHPYLHSRQPLEAARDLRGYDAVVYVLGNCSVTHGQIYRLAQTARCGDYCVLADAVMVNFQYDIRGEQGAAAYASGILGREVTPAEYHSWMARPMTLPILAQEEFLADGWRPIVHSRITKAEMERRTGASVRWIPHPVTAQYDPGWSDPGRRRKARERLGFSDHALQIVTAGGMARNKGLVEAVLAMRELRDWRIPARLVFVGDCPGDLRQQLEGLAQSVGVADRIVFAGRAERWEYEDYIHAADVGLQLRKVPFGQTSGGLADCIAAGLVTVANAAMAAAIDAPDYVLTVPDIFSPSLIAEKIAEAGERRGDRRRIEDERAAYVDAHSPQTMARGYRELAG